MISTLVINRCLPISIELAAVNKVLRRVFFLFSRSCRLVKIRKSPSSTVHGARITRKTTTAFLFCTQYTNQRPHGRMMTKNRNCDAASSQLNERRTQRECHFWGASADQKEGAWNHCRRKNADFDRRDRKEAPHSILAVEVKFSCMQCLLDRLSFALNWIVEIDVWK